MLQLFDRKSRTSCTSAGKFCIPQTIFVLGGDIDIRENMTTITFCCDVSLMLIDGVLGFDQLKFGFESKFLIFGKKSSKKKFFLELRPRISKLSF